MDIREFSILGAIVDSDADKMSAEDLTNQQFARFISGLLSKQQLNLHINSCGGSVYAGIGIAQNIKQLIAKGHKVVCYVDGLAASIASVIACSCSEIVLPKSSCLMIHNCWSVVQGNSDDLRREADLMDRINEAIINFYVSKFDLSREELHQLMDEETWIFGSEAEEYKLHCNVVDDEVKYKIAAMLTDKNFKHIPKNLMENIEEKKEEIAEVLDTEVQEVKAEETASELHEETAVDEETPVVKDEQSEAEEQKIVAEVKTEMIALDECNKRISGMQSTMAKKLDSLKADYEAKIEDFMNQIRVKDEELAKFKDEAISLKTRLDEAAKELQETVSALEAKKSALAVLNANVNHTEEELPTMQDGLAKCKTPAEKVAFLKSGKYTK